MTGAAVGKPVAEPLTMQLMRVVVPPGVSGGQLMQVQTPSGLMQVVVPRDAGESF